MNDGFSRLKTENRVFTLEYTTYIVWS